MSTMDLKGIAWVGNIYQKFEAMCLEVEETMYEDTAKYVENQVQTVGASVKRFYSDVMQDLLPPSCTDPMKVVDTDLSLIAYDDVEIHKKSKSGNKEDTKLVTEVCKEISGVGMDRKSSFKGLDNLSNVSPKFYGGFVKGQCTELYSEKNKAREMHRRPTVGIKRISKRDNYTSSEKSSSKNPLPKDSSRALSDCCEVISDQIVMLSSRASVEIKGCDSREEGEKCDNIMDTNVSVHDAKIESPVLDHNLSEDSSGKKGASLRRISSSGGLPRDSLDTCTNSVLVSQRGSDTGGDIHSNHSADEEEVFISHADVIKNNDVNEPRVEGTKQDGKSKLEETCVLVDGDKLVKLPVDPTMPAGAKTHIMDLPGASPLGLKKFRKAFSLKMRSGRKQEYEQLAAQHGDADTPSNINSGDNAMCTLIMENSNSCESEWELL
ncbi:hypothetical protein LguiB_029660 [Lonicera macranthoides]